MRITEGRTLPQFVRDLLASPPHRGEGLNLWLYRVARVLHPYRDASEIIDSLRAATDGEPVKRGEIERAVERSKATAWQPGQPYQVPQVSAWPKTDFEKRKSIIATGERLVDLWESSPVRVRDNRPRTEAIIDIIFPGNPLLCAGESTTDFATKPRNEWRGKLSRLSLIVPNPMTARIGKTQDGKASAHALSITGPRRFLVVEQDTGTIDEQAAILLHLATRYAPLALAVHSGGKSIHGWFYCHGQPEEKLRAHMKYFVTLGCDPATWCRSQFVRLPDGLRQDTGKRQGVYYFNPAVIK